MRISVDAQPLINPVKSGIGYYGHCLVKELSRSPEAEQTLEFFAFRHSAEKLAIAEEYRADNVQLDACRWFASRIYLLAASVLPIPRRLFFRNRTDVNFYFNFILPPCVHGKKTVVVHDMVFRDCPETASFKTKLLLRLYLKRSMKRADRVITVSEFSRSRIIHYYGVPEEKISIVPCGVDCDRFKPCSDNAVLEKIRHKYGICGKYILYLGTLEPRKNILNLVKAYQAFTENKTDFPVLVISGGKGWLYDEIFAYIKENGLEDRIIFTGYIADDEKAPLLSGAEFFCFPSLYEGFGMPILEAMACGTPVLTSNAASMPEVGGSACEYCDPLSAEDIKNKLELLWDSPGRRRELSELGLRRARLFSWRSSAEKLMGIFSEL